MKFITQSFDSDIAGRFQQEVLNNPEIDASYKSLEVTQGKLNELDDALE
jgi:hypothetical protein